jgi:hypothetical protein
MPNRVCFEFIPPVDACPIVRFLCLKRLIATRIKHELEAVLGRDVIPYSMATGRLRSALWTQTDSEIPHSEIDKVTVQALGQVLFASVKELSQRLCCAPTTVYRHLTESLHFVSKHLQWVSHDLTSAQKFLG